MCQARWGLRNASEGLRWFDRSVIPIWHHAQYDYYVHMIRTAVVCKGIAHMQNYNSRPYVFKQLISVCFELLKSELFFSLSDY